MRKLQQLLFCYCFSNGWLWAFVFIFSSCQLFIMLCTQSCSASHRFVVVFFLYWIKNKMLGTEFNQNRFRWFPFFSGSNINLQVFHCYFRLHFLLFDKYIVTALLIIWLTLAGYWIQSNLESNYSILKCIKLCIDQRCIVNDSL